MPTSEVQEGDPCSVPTCNGVLIEKEEGKFVCDEKPGVPEHQFGKRSVDVSGN